MLELGLIYTDINNVQTISNTNSSFNSQIKLSDFPNLGLYPLWTPISSLLCGQVYNFYLFTQSSFQGNDGQLVYLSQISNSQLIGNYLLMQTSQVLGQINQNLVTNDLLMVSGFNYQIELQNDAQFQKLFDPNNPYYSATLSDGRFYSIKNLDIQNMMTLIFDYYTQLPISDIIFVSQSLTSSNQKMFAISQFKNATGLYLSVTIEGNNIIFSSQLVEQQIIYIGLSISCSPPFKQTTINLSINYTSYEQQIIQGVCFNMQKTNQKLYLGYYEAISQNPNQFKSITNLIIVKGTNVSGIYSQDEILKNYRQIQNCQFIIQSTQSNSNQCLKCAGEYLLSNNQCIKSQDCIIIDQITKNPQFSQVIGNTCILDCQNGQIIKPNSMCDYDYLAQSGLYYGTVNLTEFNSSFLVDNLNYVDNPQIFLGISGIEHDNTTQGYNFTLFANDIQQTQFYVNLSEFTNKTYSSFLVSYLVAPQNSSKIEIGRYQLNSSYIVKQPDETIQVYLFPFKNQKLYIPNVVVGVASYFGINNQIRFEYAVQNITYLGFSIILPATNETGITEIQYIAFKGLMFEQKFNFTENNQNGWGVEPQNSTFRYLNTLNKTFVEQVDPNIKLFSMISGMIKTNDTYQGLSVYNVNNTINYGKLVVDYVQANKSALQYFKSSSIFLYDKCKISGCLYSDFDNNSIINYDLSLFENQNHPLKSGSGLRQFVNRVYFDKFFENKPKVKYFLNFNQFYSLKFYQKVFLYFEEINIPEASYNTSISFEFRPQNINYDGFDLVYEVYDNFLLQSMRIKYFATQNTNVQIGEVVVNQDDVQQWLQLQNNTSAQYYPITTQFQNQFSQIPQVMVSVFSYSGNQTTNLNFDIQIQNIDFNSVTFNVQIIQNLTQFKFQYIAVQNSSLIEIQNLKLTDFNNTPIAVSFDPIQIILDPATNIINTNSTSLNANNSNLTSNTTNTQIQQNTATTQTNTNSTSQTNLNQNSTTAGETNNNTSTLINNTFQNQTQVYSNITSRRFLQTNNTQTSNNSTDTTLPLDSNSGSSNSTTYNETSNQNQTNTNSSSNSTGTSTPSDPTSGTNNQNSTNTNSTNSNGNNQTNIYIPETIIYNNWLTKYWDRWNITSFSNASSIIFNSPSSKILYPIYSLQLGAQTMTSIDFQTKGSIQLQNGLFYYSAYLNLERYFIQSFGISMMGTLMTCPNWCVKCDIYGVCLQCKGSNLQPPNCNCKEGYTLDPTYGCIQCFNGCCKSDPSSTICDSCSDSSLYKQLNCNCYTNQQVLYITWKNKIQLNITLVNGGEIDSFNLLGCSTCSIVKTGRTIILTQNSLSLNNFAIYSTIGNSLGVLEYQVSMLAPPQFICFGSIKQEKTFMINLSPNQNSQSDFDHLQNSLSYCSDRTTNSKDGSVTQFTPMSLNWKNTYGLKYQNNTFLLSDLTQSIDFFSLQFYLSYNITIRDGKAPSYNIRCDGFKLAQLGSYQNIKPGISNEAQKEDNLRKQYIYSQNFQQNKTDRINLIVQAWFLINQMQDKAIYSLFEVFSQDERTQFGVSCTKNSILINYQNTGDFVYQKSNFPIINGLDNLSDEWFYVSLDWINGLFQSNFTVKLIRQKGFWSSNITVYEENTAQFDFSLQKLNITINNPIYFQGSQWNGQTMDFGFYNYLNTKPDSSKSIATESLNMNDNALLFQKTYQKIVFFYEFKMYKSINFIYDYSNNNNNFMDQQIIDALNSQGLLVKSNQFFTIPNSIYLGQINEEYGFVIGFTIYINKVSPFEGTLLNIGQLEIRLVLQDGYSDSKPFQNFQEFYSLQICAYQVQCVNSKKLQIPINSQNSFGILIQIVKVYYGNRRVLSISLYSQTVNDENIIFNLQQASSGFNSFNQTQNSDNLINSIVIGSQNNYFNNPDNNFVIGRLIVQSGSYVKPFDILIQQQTDKTILQNASQQLGITLETSDQVNSMMLNRLMSQKCILQLGKYNQDQVCAKCNSNYQNVQGTCVSNGECNQYYQELSFQQPVQKGAYFYDYDAKQCLPCSNNCMSCKYSSSNCITCLNGFINPPSCSQCGYINGDPTFYNPDTQSCVNQCPANYCTDKQNLICTKCDGVIRNIFQDFYLSQQFSSFNWVISRQVIQNSLPNFISCFVYQYQLSFFGGAGTLNQQSILSTQIKQIPLHYQISYSFLLLISKTDFQVDNLKMKDILQLYSDGILVSNYELKIISQNSMICSNQLPQSSVYFVNATILHQNTATLFNITFNFKNSSSQSQSLNWGIRSFKIDIFQCHYSCFTCSGPGVFECLSCTADLIFMTGRCVCPQKSQYLTKKFDCWSNPCFTCQTCNSPCQLCDNENICLQCINGFFLYEGVCYQDCRNIPSNQKYWPFLMNDNAKRLCLPTNLTDQIQLFNNDTFRKEFQYSKYWVQSPAQTPGQYLLQCGTNNFVGQFGNTNFSRIFQLSQPYYQLTIQFQLLLLNNLTGKSLFNVELNKKQLVSQGATNFSQFTQLSQCLTYPSPQLVKIQISNITFSDASFQLSLFSQNFDSVSWAFRNLTIISSLCPIYCSECLSDSKCTKCVNGGIPEFQCQCGSNYVYSLKPKCSIQPCGYCMPCDESCFSCSGPGPFNCIKCKIGYKKLGERCVLQCPDNYYFNTNQNECLLCDTSCFNCMGPNPDNCISCYAPQVLEYSRCVNSCTMQNLVLDSFSQTCQAQNNPNSILFLNDPSTFSSNINMLFSPSNPKQSILFSTCGSQLFAGPFNSQVILQIPQINRHSQLIIQFDILVQQNTTINISSSYQYLNTNYQQKINLSSQQTCLSSQIQTQNVFAYVNSFTNYFRQNMEITLTSSTSLFYIKNMNITTFFCHASCQTCKGPLPTDCLGCVDGAVLLPNNSCTCIDQQKTLMFIQGSQSQPFNSYCSFCQYPCTTCFQADNFSCSSCQQGFYLKDYSCVTSCPPLKYQQLANLGLCKPCPFPCDQCTSDGQYCLTCQEGYVLTMTRQCKPSCWDQQYVDQNNVCQSCDISCFSCSGPLSSDCTQCNLGYFQDSQSGSCLQCHPLCLQCSDQTNFSCSQCQYGVIFKNNSICTLDCSEIPGTYAYDGDCLPCNSQCKSCDGPDFSDCLECQDGFTLVNSLCVPCSSKCLRCFGTTSEQCYSCADGFVLQGNSCVLQCDSGYYLQNKICYECNEACSICSGPLNSQCTACRQGYYFLNNICLPCHPYCQNCFGPYQNNCLYCNKGNFLLRTQCYNNSDGGCPKGYYGNIQTRLCALCDASCLTCQGSSQNVCLSCPQGSYMTQLFYDISGSVLPSSCSPCPSVCQICTSATQCIQCQTNYYLYQNTCLIRCPNGYYGSDVTGKCQPCGNNCTTCTGFNSQGDFICNSCLTGYYLEQNSSCQQCSSNCFICRSSSMCIQCLQGYYNYQGFCLTQCPYGYYASDSTQSCVQCVKPCSLCTSSTMCQACQVGYFLQENYNQSNILVSSSCQVCNSVCNDCSAGTALDCMSCKTPLSLQGIQCQQQCDVGFYSDYGVCLKCGQNCLQCSSTTNCTLCTSGYISINGVCQLCNFKCSSCFGVNETQCNSCIYPYYLYQSTCQLKCPDQFFKQNFINNQTSLQENICSKCNSSCFNCFGLEDNKCLSCINGFYLTPSNTCAQCSQICNTCSQTSTQCTSCPLGQYLYNQTCASQCPSGFYGSDQDNKCHQCNSPCNTCSGPGANQCTSCLETFFYSQGQCLPCHSNCKTCYGFTQNECYTCQLGMQHQGNSCISCGDGKYYDNFLNSCEECNPVCENCYGSSSTNCLTCQSGKYLSQSNCNICPSSCSSCQNQNMCTSCAISFFLLALSSQNQICIQSCPVGMVDNSYQQCQCSSNCNQCIIDPNSLQVTCTKCTTQNFVIDLFTKGNQFACIENTKCQGFIDIQSNSCIQSCPPSAPFIDFVSQQCIQNSCPEGTVTQYITGQGQCFKECPQGYYPNSQQICSPCHPLCSKCSGPLPNQCQQCVSNIFYHPVIQTCSDTCLIGYTLDSSSGYCVVCYNFCKVCLPNLVLFNGLCLEECPVGYTQTISMLCVESSNQIVKILNSFKSAIGITKDVILQASLFVLGPIKSIEWILKRSTDAQFQASFDLLNINSLTLTIPFLILKSSQSYSFRLEVILASDEILNDEISFMTAGEIIAGTFIINPTTGFAGSDLFQFSVQNYKYPKPLLFDISYYTLQVQYSNTIADDGSIQKQANPSFVKAGLVQIYNSIPFNQAQSSILTYQFPIYYESDQNIACEIKIYSADGSVERYDYTIITLKKTVKVDQSIFAFNTKNVFDSLSFLNYILNIRVSFVIDANKLKALQQNNNINQQIAISNKKTYNYNAQCDQDIDCFGQGTCILALNLYSCQCLQGYLGLNCQWQQSEYIFLQANIPQYISYILSQNTANFSGIIVAQAIGNVFYYTDFNDKAIQLASMFINILNANLNNALDQIQIQIYQSICQFLITTLQNTLSQQASSQIQQLQALNISIQNISFQNINMGESLTQQSETSDSAAIPLSLQTISTSNTATNGKTPQGRRQLRRLKKLQKIRLLQSSSDSNTAIPVVFRSLTVSIPPEVIDTAKKVVVSGTSFKVDPRANPFAITTTLSLSLGGSSGAQNVSDAPKPIIMTIPKKVPSPPGVNSDAVQCAYFDEETNSYKSDGCTLVKETITSIICSCTHLTDFSATLQPQQIQKAINLNEMKEAQKVGNSLLSASTPAVITIQNLPAPKIGQRNVNLVNAINIQLSGGILNVLAKQTYIVTQDGENYATYSMWDYIQQESVQNLINNSSNDNQDNISQQSNEKIGSLIIIGVVVVGLFFKTGIRASFKFKFLDDEEAPAEMILNNIHKKIKNNNEQDEIDHDKEKNLQILKDKDKEYDFSIAQSHNLHKIKETKSNPNSPKEICNKISIQDEVVETLSNFSPAHRQGKMKLTKKAIDEVTKKAMQLKKKYEQEQKLIKIIEKNQEVSSQDNQSQIQDLQSQIKQEQVKMNESLCLSPRNQQMSKPFTPFKKSQFVKQTTDQSQNNLSKSIKNSPSNNKSLNNASKFTERLEEIQRQTQPIQKSKKEKNNGGTRMVFQKVNLVIQEQDLQKLNSNQQIKEKKKKKKQAKANPHKIQENMPNEEIVLTTEADDDHQLIKQKIVNQQQKQPSPHSANVVKKSQFSNNKNQVLRSSVLKNSINLQHQQSNTPKSKQNIFTSFQTINKNQELKISNLESQLRIQGLKDSNLQFNLSQEKQQELREKNQQIENELAILKMRENVQMQKQKISSNNINPIYSIFHAKDTLFQTKMSRILYVYTTLYGYLAFDFYIYDWCAKNTPNQPFINYLFYFNPARILLMIILSNAVSHTFYGFLNQIFSSFIRKQEYELITTKILNRLRAQHLTCYIIIFLSLFAIYSSSVNSFAQTQFFTMSQMENMVIEVIGAFMIDLFIFDLFLVIFHKGFVSSLPDEIPFKRNFEIFQSQRGFFYTQQTEHPKIMDIII